MNGGLRLVIDRRGGWFYWSFTDLGLLGAMSILSTVGRGAKPILNIIGL